MQSHQLIKIEAEEQVDIQNYSDCICYGGIIFKFIKVEGHFAQININSCQNCLFVFEWYYYLLFIVNSDEYQISDSSHCTVSAHNDSLTFNLDHTRSLMIIPAKV